MYPFNTQSIYCPHEHVIPKAILTFALELPYYKALEHRSNPIFLDRRVTAGGLVLTFSLFTFKDTHWCLTLLQTLTLDGHTII